MPVEKWTPERRRQLTRDALIDAAAHVFTQRGFHAASLDEIAETAGFTRGAIYKNFADKEELFFAVFDRSTEVNLAAFADRMDSSEGSELDAGAVADIWEAVRGRDRDNYVLELEFRLYALRNPEVQDRYASHMRTMRGLIVRFIEERTEEAGITLAVPVEEVAVIVESASEGFLASAYLDPELGPLFGRFLELFMPVLVADGAPAPAAAPAATKRPAAAARTRRR
ncbi:MAG: TetR/AcrR family transcriptional regulator [Actinobacteria bacterium]|nr:TetR/AcrR family transcriptional regulator [Actinomycetota bacterium]MBV9253666.1 TetR/AcrR family transcriptional regulator [Actinomycetota bacterium]